MASSSDEATPKPDDDAAIRRVPQQHRSRQKVTKILDTTMALIQESGMDSVSMREIARESGLPIATVYQYFPNKQSIVRQIWEGYTSAVGSLLEAELAALLEDPSTQSLKRVIDHIVDNISDSHETNPGFVEIRRCVDATPDLRQLNFDDTMRVAGLIKKVMLGINPNAKEADVANYALIATEAATSTVRLGQQMPPARRRELLTSLKTFLLQFFTRLSE